MIGSNAMRAERPKRHDAKPRRPYTRPGIKEHVELQAIALACGTVTIQCVGAQS